MSAENVDAIRHGYDAWNRSDLDALREIYAPDVTANAGGLWPTAGEVSGVEAIIEAFSSILATFKSCELVPEEFIERGESVVVPTRWRGSIPDSDSVIEQRVVAVYTFRDGRVVRIEYFPSREDALQTLDEP